jgi:hypothetical protein
LSLARPRAEARPQNYRWEFPTCVFHNRRWLVEQEIVLL